MGVKEQMKNIKRLVNCTCSFSITYWAFRRYSLSEGMFESKACLKVSSLYCVQKVIGVSVRGNLETSDQ